MSHQELLKVVEAQQNCTTVVFLALSIRFAALVVYRDCLAAVVETSCAGYVVAVELPLRNHMA
jgi:uncharacterized membrane protein (DUF485 family)